ncbi:putative glyocosyltransferase protein [Francisella philomiragia]|uniref:hypothetical protein n=1 Tax=Francisella philomiragia TaxID=28110 RepID=UPI0005A5695A|nr:hypothetical protein [Francisella philomiragia]AJI57215.1 putative glyocosyltransferase protein [Francisella philomiragia]
MKIVEKFTPPHPLNTPVLFLIFNRLDTTKRVFEAIRQVKPPKLYIAADGARKSKPEELTKVLAVREYVLSNIDWQCEIKTLFRDENLGCKYAVSGGINWFFDNEEMGIILEDDCLPSQSFFWYCEELLNRYKDNPNIYLISGDGRGANEFGSNYSYNFVKYALIWGWASWASRWAKYDISMNDWESSGEKIVNSISENKATRRYWWHALKNTYKGEINTWDYQLNFTLFKNNGMCITPMANMVTNIGFSVNATNTTDMDSPHANIPHFDLGFPLKHPSNVDMNASLNSFYDNKVFSREYIGYEEAYINTAEQLSKVEAMLAEKEALNKMLQDLMHNNKWYHFGQLSSKRKIMVCCKLVTKKLRIYNIIAPVVRFIKKLLGKK